MGHASIFRYRACIEGGFSVRDLLKSFATNSDLVLIVIAHSRLLLEANYLFFSSFFVA